MKSDQVELSFMYDKIVRSSNKSENSGNSKLNTLLMKTILTNICFSKTTF